MSYSTCPSNAPSQVITCILTNVALWLPEYSKCGIFARMEERGLCKNMLPDIRFLREHRVVMFWWKGVPQQKSYKHILVHHLPWYLSINLSIYCFISVDSPSSFYWTSLVCESAYLLSKMFFLYLECLPRTTNSRSGKRSSKWLSVRNDLSIFLSSKKLVMTNLRVLYYLSL